jgi:hypothetical protein
MIGIVTVRDSYDRENCLRAGCIWQRAHLLATARGLAGRPCNEAVETIDQRESEGKEAGKLNCLGRSWGTPRGSPTFVFYLSYPTLKAKTSPRYFDGKGYCWKPTMGFAAGKFSEKTHAAK